MFIHKRYCFPAPGRNGTSDRARVEIAVTLTLRATKTDFISWAQSSRSETLIAVCLQINNVTRMPVSWVILVAPFCVNCCLISESFVRQRRSYDKC